jgi:hypothetical protein
MPVLSHGARIMRRTPYSITGDSVPAFHPSARHPAIVRCRSNWPSTGFQPCTIRARLCGDQRTAAYDDRIERIFKHHERCKRLAKIEGVGPLVAAAVVAAVGNASEFKSGRDLLRGWGWSRGST